MEWKQEICLDHGCVEDTLSTTAGDTEVRLRNCLEPRIRRWCTCEFFCSAIDRPWLMRNELTDYLGHVGIPKGTRLTRPELAIIRASLGKPRRLSLNYLRQVQLLALTISSLHPETFLLSRIVSIMQVRQKCTVG